MERKLDWGTLVGAAGVSAHTLTHIMRITALRNTVRVCFVVYVALLAFPTVWPTAAVADESASGVLLYQKIDATTLHYNIDLKNTGSTPLGTLWYSWIPTPSEDFLGVRPTNIASPAGWTATVTNNGANDGFAIMFVNSGSALLPGNTLLGFSFDSSETPAELSGNSPFFPSSAMGTTFVYSGGPFSDSGFQFQINPTNLPWQNPFSALDVDNNGAIQPHDAAVVINALIKGGPRSLAIPTTTDAIPPFVDTHGDNILSAADAIAVINHLIKASAATAAVLSQNEAEPLADLAGLSFRNSSIQSVPEPSSIALLAIGSMAMLGARQVRLAQRRRRVQLETKICR